MPTPTTPDPSAPCLTSWLQGKGGDTLGGIETIVMDTLAEGPGVPGAGNPVARRRAVIEACDEVARRTHCLHTAFAMDIKAGQASYCPPATLLEADGVLALDPDGVLRPLRVASGVAASNLRSAHSFYGGNYRHDYQWAMSATGAGAITLYPTPDTDRAGALWISGYFAPGKVWEIDPVTFAPRDLDASHECPLPAFAHEAVRAESVRRRVIQLLTIRKELGEFLGLYTQEAGRLIEQAESHAAQMWEGVRGVGVRGRGGYRRYR